MTFNFATWECVYDKHEMFKVNICDIIAAMASISSGMKTTVRWTPGYYGLGCDPFKRLSHAPRGLSLLDSGVKEANRLIQDIFHQKLLSY